MDFTIQNQKDTRSGFGEGLLEAGRRNPKVVAFCADLTGSVKMGDFAKEFPNRFFQTGIAEANMIDMAAGMALSGFVPFTGTFAAFATGRVYDQIRQSVAYSNKNVKIAASHAGVTLGEDGATHQILEDIALMKVLPNMTVMLGNIFIIPMSSRIWCVAPSSPRVTPAWEAAIFTFLLE